MNLPLHFKVLIIQLLYLSQSIMHNSSKTVTVDWQFSAHHVPLM